MTEPQSSATAQAKPPARRKRRFLLWVGVLLGGLLVLAGAGVIGLPQVLSSGWMRPKILGVIKPMIAPGALSVERFEITWDKPLVMHGFQIRDQDGTVVIDSKKVMLSRNLWQLIMDPNDMGTMSFDEAVMDVRREADGTINLVRALGKLIEPKAERDFAIVIRKSTLKVFSPELFEPFVSNDAEVLIDLPKSPAPLGFQLDASGAGARKAKFGLSIRGTIERWTDKSVDIVAEFDRWPIAGSGMGVGATAWATGRVKVTEGPKTYHIQPKVRADIQWSDSADLPAIVKAVDRFQLQSDIRAAIEPTVEISLKETHVDFPGIDVALQGKAADVGGAKAAVDFNGHVKIDSARIKELMAKNEAGPVDIEISPILFSAKGPLAKKELQAMQASFSTDVKHIKTGGIQLGALKLDARWADGQLAIAPIDTTVNDGRLHLEPKVEMTADAVPARVLLGPRTTLTRMSLDTITSQNYMVYPAPALASATTVAGFISAKISDGVIPLADKSRPLSLKGDMAFEDVRFGPGPWLLNLTQSVGLPPPPTFAIDQPIQFEILGDRVIQHGLSIPVGQLTRLDFSGEVTFKKQLDLMVQVPVTPTMLQNVPLFRSFLGTEQFKIPIRGTLDKPEVDKEAFDLTMKQLGENLKNRAVDTSLDMLFNGLLRGKVPRFIPGPNDPQPPAPRP